MWSERRNEMGRGNGMWRMSYAYCDRNDGLGEDRCRTRGLEQNSVGRV